MVHRTINMSLTRGPEKREHWLWATVICDGGRISALYFEFVVQVVDSAFEASSVSRAFERSLCMGNGCRLGNRLFDVSGP